MAQEAIMKAMMKGSGQTIMATSVLLTSLKEITVYIHLQKTS